MFLHKFDILNRNLNGLFQKLLPVCDEIMRRDEIRWFDGNFFLPNSFLFLHVNFISSQYGNFFLPNSFLFLHVNFISTQYGNFFLPNSFLFLRINFFLLNYILFYQWPNDFFSDCHSSPI